MTIDEQIKGLSSQQEMELLLLLGQAVVDDLRSQEKAPDNYAIPVRRAAITHCHRSIFNHSIEQVKGGDVAPIKPAALANACVDCNAPVSMEDTVGVNAQARELRCKPCAINARYGA